MVSVIVPVYNVEKYLKRCVDSIINQTYKELEIILVDDGATDASGTICDEYLKIDTRIQVIHKENGGLSDARNAGAKVATGEYIIFIDSDDFIELNMIEFLTSHIGDADMSICGFFSDYASGSYPYYKGDELDFETDNEATFKIMLEGDIFAAYVWNKMIKAEIVHQIQFEVGRLYEDIFYSNKLMPLIKKVRISTKPLYHYIRREGSITTNQFNARTMDIVDGYKEAYEVTKEFFPSIQEYGEFRYLWSYFVVLDRMLLLDNYKSLPQYQKVVSFLRKNLSKVLKNKQFSKNRKIAAIFLKMNINLYKILFKFNERNRKELIK